MTKIDRLVAATEAVATALGRASRFRDYLPNLDVQGDYLDELLHQLRKDLEEVEPLMDEFRRPFAAACERPPDHVGQCEGSSHHLLAFNIAFMVYEAMARHQWAASAIVGWSRDEPILRGDGERAALARREAAEALHRWLPFNCESLKKMIEHESVRTEERLKEHGNNRSAPPTLRYDATTRTLYIDRTMVKIFRKSAHNQTLILEEFQKNNWELIQNPLRELEQLDQGIKQLRRLELNGLTFARAGNTAKIVTRKL